ncbi:hypothetical protein P43SY_007053 [Pythium insidiosum]|uniref:Uncharacterized protein n=1 Tax=Pythium insidiosum TaxID=114742 RepID=A0AAD5LPV1_PYTIN|nr:hypothetical protein P43SY_007053 [Pythium insidiosum]
MPAGQGEHQRDEHDAGDSALAETPRPLTRELVQARLSSLGKNPYTLAHVFTTATLTDLELTDLTAISAFPHLQHVLCASNRLHSLAPLGELPLLLSVDASHNELRAALDIDVPQCTPERAWVGGGQWLGSLLRRADLSFNRIVTLRADLATAHPFLQELRLAHNELKEIRGIAGLRFLRVLDLSHNRLTTTRGLLSAGNGQGLEALEELVLRRNQLSDIDAVASLPRLTTLDVAYNRLTTLDVLEHATRLQRLDASCNALASVNALNALIPLPLLQSVVLRGCPLVASEASTVFYRARVLRRLQQLVELDDDVVSAKEKIKALMMHGSDVQSRQRTLHRHLPSQQFVNHLPPLEFEDDAELETFYRERFGASSHGDELSLHGAVA